MNIANTIPLIVDDVKDLPDFPMTRLNYFSVETLDYLSELMISHSSLEMPVIVIDLQGVITSTRDHSIFSSKELIQSLIDSIDDTEELFVDINDVWLPNIILRKKLERGDLIRIPKELFRLALAYRSDNMPYKDFLSSAAVFSREIEESELEEKAFKEWASEQIRFAKKIYHLKDDSKKLSYSEEENEMI